MRSNPERFGAVRGRVAQLYGAAGILRAECRAVVLGIDEALTNIIGMRTPAPHDHRSTFQPHPDFLVRKNGKRSNRAGDRGKSGPRKIVRTRA